MAEWSKSTVIDALRCGLRHARSLGTPKPENARLTRGRLIALIDAQAKRGRYLGAAGNDPDLEEEVCRDYNEFREAVPLAPIALYENVEEDAVSAALRHESLYDGEPRPNFAVTVPGTDHVICGARDSVRLAEDYSAQIVDDTKSSDYMEYWAKRVEAVWYVIPTIIEHPGYPEYQVRQQYVRSGTESVQRFTEAELPALFAEAVALIEQAETATKAARPRLNQFCSDCPVQDCQARSLVTLSQPDPLMNLGAMSMSQLDAADDQLGFVAKIITANRDRIDAEQIARVRVGTIIEDGRQWSLGARKKTILSVSQTASLAASALKCGAINEDDFASIFSVGLGAVKKLKTKAPEMVASILALAREIDGNEMIKRGNAPKQIEVPPSSYDGGPLARRGEIRETPTAVTVATGNPSDSDGTDSGSPGVLEQSDAAPETGALSQLPVMASQDCLDSTHRCFGCDQSIGELHKAGCDYPEHKPVQPPPGEIPFTHPLEDDYEDRVPRLTQAGGVNEIGSGPEEPEEPPAAMEPEAPQKIGCSFAADCLYQHELGAVDRDHSRQRAPRGWRRTAMGGFRPHAQTRK